MSEQTFGSFISQKRREKGISLRKFAESLGKFPSYICDIEKDRVNRRTLPILIGRERAASSG